MSAPFVAEIRIFPYNFAPTGWALCNGQILPIAQNTALFSLIGTYYGGNGQSTFALPNLMGMVALHQGQGAGLSAYFLGQSAGSETVALLQTEIPGHNHSFNVTNTVGTVTASGGNQLAKGQKGNVVTGVTQARVYSTGASNSTLNPTTAMGPTGGDQPHNNLMPYMALNYCIALQGVFPPRT
jgi:microcystin-dependent protein